MLSTSVAMAFYEFQGKSSASASAAKLKTHHKK